MVAIKLYSSFYTQILELKYNPILTTQKSKPESQNEHFFQFNQPFVQGV